MVRGGEEGGMRGNRVRAERLRDQEKATRVSAGSFGVVEVGQDRGGRSAREGSEGDVKPCAWKEE